MLVHLGFTNEHLLPETCPLAQIWYSRNSSPPTKRKFIIDVVWVVTLWRIPLNYSTYNHNAFSWAPRCRNIDTDSTNSVHYHEQAPSSINDHLLIEKLHNSNPCSTTHWAAVRPSADPPNFPLVLINGRDGTWYIKGWSLPQASYTLHEKNSQNQREYQTK